MYRRYFEQLSDLGKKSIDFLFKTEKTNKSLIVVGETDDQNFNITQVARAYENQGNGQVNGNRFGHFHLAEYVNYDHPVSYNTLYLVDDFGDNKKQLKSQMAEQQKKSIGGLEKIDSERAKVLIIVSNDLDENSKNELQEFAEDQKLNNYYEQTHILNLDQFEEFLSGDLGVER
ncbi:hypothetical protein OTSGILL_0288 [Orientia tsutsugamushi str. Gilliam]|uniref:Uncharacterized protein n=2 Tax=Orientia tsutsugamushi str. Gilliam TaxID=1359184 RepID=A0A0F3MDW8_ORITS|nr:hypothetical protein [Orientia tsutsugamushi]KJV53945.1 hypothetical protein OTSGILL_0288 [Orientia tsutsugamushi str. Gilliam]SPR09346.1 Uncharacterised protein [Orientia tsutsugamushi str. Gilliam]